MDEVSWVAKEEIELLEVILRGEVSDEGFRRSAVARERSLTGWASEASRINRSRAASTSTKPSGRIPWINCGATILNPRSRCISHHANKFGRPTAGAVSSLIHSRPHGHVSLTDNRRKSEGRDSKNLTGLPSVVRASVRSTEAGPEFARGSMLVCMSS
jgi:hypothetical protein